MDLNSPEYLAATRRAFMIPGMIWPREMLALSQLFGKSKRHAEIGTFCGKSLYATAAAMHLFGDNDRRCFILAVDNFSERLVDGSSFVPSIDWWKQVVNATVSAITKEFAIDVQIVDGASTDVARQVASEPQHDSIYIDANHSEEYVAQDILSWWPLLREGGIMAGHDYSPECLGTMNAVNDAFGSTFRVMPDTRIWYVSKDDLSNQELSNFRRLH